MSLLGATSDGLKQHAADFSALAGELAAGTVPTNAGLSCQLTAAAAQSLHAEVEAAGATLAARVRATAVTVYAVAAGYERHEAEASSQLSL